MATKALPYPRPVSPLNIEDIPLCAGTYIYAEPKSDDTEAEAALRASKRRRRIRDNAEAVLRGESIFILSAGIKGPFRTPWSNPWRETQKTVEKEIPETAHHTRIVGRTPPTVSGSKDVRSRHADYVDLTVDDIEFTQPPIVTHKSPKDVFKKTTAPRVVAPNEGTFTTAERVEDWLRTNDAFGGSSGSVRAMDIRSSPTPATRPSREAAPDLEPKRPVSADGQNMNTEIGNWARLQNPVAEAEIEQNSSQQTHESQDRAEAAILENKRRSVHRLPPSTNLPAFEYRRGRRPNKAPDAEGVQEEANQVTDAVVLDKDYQSKSGPNAKAAIPQPETVKSQVPDLSRETSKATTRRELPAGQVTSEIVLGISNAQSTGELLQPVQPPTQTSLRDGVLEGGKSGAELQKEHPPREEAASTAQDPADDEMDTTDALIDRLNAGLADNRTPARNLDTQALLGDIAPFPISTIKKIGMTSDKRSTPVTATRARTSATTKRTKKKASFAADPLSDESQTSIKNGFQVRKSAIIDSSLYYPKSKDAVLPQDDDDDDEPDSLDPPSIDQTHRPAPAPAPAPATDAFTVQKPFKQPKSILKQALKHPSSMPSSAPPGTTLTATAVTNTYGSTSNGSTNRPNAQPRPTAIENGTSAGLESDGVMPDMDMEGFDMDATIDDIGTWLGSWDVEREAAKIANR
ncbi:uncharacterized protein AB675_11008 [Cyphellophora attinorum]|uniref:Uncharacterized protein n=1 Tax=Cyphellophora attinorum TaxID=1664694 RepID=A0A0N1HHY8_9EURO|nr:uncharacterized protein AB675_11008 [Phialophora attinorum]KPI35543.1 hypothetical protein AB675_11008 [Phialophora attinorum]